MTDKEFLPDELGKKEAEVEKTTEITKDQVLPEAEEIVDEKADSTDDVKVEAEEKNLEEKAESTVNDSAIHSSEEEEQEKESESESKAESEKEPESELESEPEPKSESEPESAAEADTKKHEDPDHNQDTAAAAEAKADEKIEVKDESEAESKDEDANTLPPLGVDYSGFSKEELVEALQQLVDRRSIQEIRNDVENIKSAFYKRHRQILDEKKEAFLRDGGSEEEFKLPNDPLEEEYKALYSNYRQRRIEYNKVLEAEKHTNLARKREIIERIKNLVHSQESLNKTFNEFRELQNEWREAGPVPQNELASLWENYHHHVETFYDFIKINRELRDLDLKKNQEAKILLCERAEELLLEPSIVKAFKSLQDLHARWREIGPVPREKRDELWERFKETTTTINKRHQEHFQGLKDEQKKNLEAKAHLCEQVEEILSNRIDSPRKWNELSHKVVDLQKLWRTIGFAPKKDNNKIYERFRTSCDEFFNRKREFFTQHRNEQNNNLQLKTDLCIQAEALAQSTDWKQTTEDLIEIQKKWKKIGAVPRKYSDALWSRFRSACDAFFVNKQNHFVGQDSEQLDNLKKKQELIETVKAYKLSDDNNIDLENLKRFQKEFTNIGHVPFNVKHDIQQAFRDAINSHFDKLDIDEPKREILKFRQKIDNIAQSPKSKNRLFAEREKLINKLKQLESDIVLWENNIGFFAKSKTSESMINDVKKKIESGKERARSLKERIDMINNYDF